MPVTAIPFQMPEPMEIPAHLVDNLKSLPKDQAVLKGLELLLSIEAAAIMFYERVDENGAIVWGGAVGEDSDQAQQLAAALAADPGYGQGLGADNPTLSGQALAQDKALLIMGQAEAGEKNPLPDALSALALGGADSGNIGFSYVLPLKGEDGTPLGGITLWRTAPSGPLNHEQPNLTEAMRRVLSQILAAD